MALRDTLNMISLQHGRLHRVLSWRSRKAAIVYAMCVHAPAQNVSILQAEGLLGLQTLTGCLPMKPLLWALTLTTQVGVAVLHHPSIVASSCHHAAHVLLQ